MNFSNFRSTHAATQLDTPTAPRMRANAFGEGDIPLLAIFEFGLKIGFEFGVARGFNVVGCPLRVCRRGCQVVHRS